MNKKLFFVGFFFLITIASNCYCQTDEETKTIEAFKKADLFLYSKDPMFEDKTLTSYKYYSPKYDDNNIPDYAKKVCANKENNIDLVDHTKYIGISNKSLENYESEFRNNLYKQITEDCKKVDLDAFKNILIPIIKDKMKEPKKNIPASIQEELNFPDNPKFLTIKLTVKYWVAISRYFETIKNYENALLLSHSIYYLVKDYDYNYNNSSSLLIKLICFNFYKQASDSILFWAYDPKPKCKELAKLVAKDILDFVNNSFPLSKTVEYESYYLDIGINSVLKTIGYGAIDGIKTDSYKSLYNFYIKDYFLLADKPLYEIKEILDERANIREKLIKILDNNQNKPFNKKQYYALKKALEGNTNTKILNNINSENISSIKYELVEENKTIQTSSNPVLIIPEMILTKVSPNFSGAKKYYEVNLAKMEMAAIALAINSYFCENNKLPASMEELSKWFGCKLPDNRFTGKPYELNTKDGYILYNDGIDYTPNTEDDFGFKFVY